MKRKGLLSVALLAFSLLVLSGCQPSTVDTNRNASNDNSVASEAVDKPAIEAELLRIENDWPRVMKEKDGAAVRRVLSDDVILVYPDGSTATREEDAKNTEAGMVTLDSLEMTDLKVKVLTKDAAIVTGRSIMKNAQLNLPDGKKVDISGEYRFVDTFARRNAQWKLEASIATRIEQVAAPASPAASPAARTTPATAASPAARPSPAVRPSPAARPSPATNPTP